jgi:hypothetical protein
MGVDKYRRLSLRPGDAQVALKNQSGSIGPVTLLTAGITGFFEMFAFARTVTPGNGEVTITINFTDDVGATSMLLPAALQLIAGVRTTDSAPLWLDSGAITFSTVQVGTGSYNLTVACRRVNGRS